MTQRSSWTFDVPVADLTAAAEKKRDYHADRVAWWTAERDAAESKVRAEGIEIRHHQITGGTRAEAVLDPALASRLSECDGKIRTHTTEQETVERWLRVLARAETAGKASLAVDFDDVTYFRL